jgi:ketosteroid isomerase-like protein
MVRAVSILLALALGACDPALRPWTTEGAHVDAIRAAEARLTEAIAGRDAATALSFYHEDAWIEHGAPLDEHSISAVASYRHLFAGVANAIEYAPTRIEASQGGDLAASYGECVITRAAEANAEPVSQQANCVKLWRPDKDGRWRIAREIREAGASVSRS